MMSRANGYTIDRSNRSDVKTENKPRETAIEKTYRIAMDRVAIYRYRMDLFVSEYLGFNLKLFQVFLLFAMQHNHYFMYLASRGQGKSWISAVYAVSRCILYPGTIIVIASGTKGQGISVLKKIQDDLLPKSAMLRTEIAHNGLRVSSNNPECLFENGSKIMVVTSNDNARSARAHVILVDEFRMVKLEVINKVLRKFLSTPRQAPFMELPEYADYPTERNKEIYLSSAWFMSHWSWDKAKTYFQAMMEGRQYFICGLPYQLPVQEKLLDKDQVLDEMAEADFDPLGWIKFTPLLAVMLIEKLGELYQRCIFNDSVATGNGC